MSVIRTWKIFRYLGIAMINFCTIASGSSGNCTYIGLGKKHFLVDAGISGKRIEHALQSIKLHARDISGIFITHEHYDHTTGAGVLARRFGIPIYATPETWRYFLRTGSIGKKINDDIIRYINPNETLFFEQAAITAFEISHDACQPVGYTFEVNEEKAVILTDLGEVTDSIKKHLKGAGILMLESNHDPNMLKNGCYPEKLKARVASKLGHLSNAQAGTLLVEVAGSKLEYIVLAHLSEENNTPLLAFETVKRILDINGVYIKQLSVAGRHKPGRLLQYGD